MANTLTYQTEHEEGYPGSRSTDSSGSGLLFHSRVSSSGAGQRRGDPFIKVRVVPDNLRSTIPGCGIQSHLLRRPRQQFFIQQGTPTLNLLPPLISLIQRLSFVYEKAVEVEPNGTETSTVFANSTDFAISTGNFSSSLNPTIPFVILQTNASNGAIISFE